ncbi:leucine zipper protein 2 isoform X5 [Gopherus flavomarginatus]|uniref:leucine zipper protein 2 isoform X5 n=1 Tax=Gopherus flavomarginatus TaxID=286002 RepID=UPI0021CBE343|nr:leucine zipper protein 2 isoform X5 [Gopherus flavomarginatus]
MKFISACYLLPFFPVLVFSSRQGYEELERQLKEVFKERSNILRQLSKTSKELEGIKVNLQSLKNDEASAKSDVQKLLELGQKQRDEMKYLQEAFQKQLNEAAEKAEKQQATINFLKTEMERKSKMIRDLQNENKSLKNKLLSGSKLCGIHAEESKKIQAQLKEFRYGKKDLIFKAQQLTDLEQKLAIAKDKLEKAALDKQNASADKGTLASTKEANQSVQDCDSQDVRLEVGKTCLGKHNNSTSPHLKVAETDPSFQKLHSPPWIKPEAKKSAETNEKKHEESDKTEEKAL